MDDFFDYVKMCSFPDIFCFCPGRWKAVLDFSYSDEALEVNIGKPCYKFSCYKSGPYACAPESASILL